MDGLEVNVVSNGKSVVCLRRLADPEGIEYGLGYLDGIYGRMEVVLCI
jgi:hypothetical protein